MAYLEKDFQTDFNKWCKIIYHRTGAFELKLSDTGSLGFALFVKHQRENLYHAKHNSIVFKIPDAGYQNPFDSFQLAGVPAFLVVMFRGKQDHFYMIDIDVILHEIKISDRKSLTEERAAEIGCKYDLKGTYPYTHTHFDIRGTVG